VPQEQAGVAGAVLSWGGKGLDETSKINSLIGVVGHDPLLPNKPRADA